MKMNIDLFYRLKKGWHPYAGLFFIPLLFFIAAILGGCVFRRDSVMPFQQFFSTDSICTVPHLKKYHLVRFEGMTRNQSALEMDQYLRKYHHKRLNGSCDDIRYFSECLLWFDHQHSSEGVQKNHPCRILFAGDLMWIGNPSPHLLSEELRSYLKSFDLVVANLETPVDTSSRVPWLLPDYIRYNSPPALLDAFCDPAKGQSFLSVVNLANNHAFDHGGQGLLNTMKMLDYRNIIYTGASRKNDSLQNFSIIEQNGYRIGIYSATWGFNQIRACDTSGVKVEVLKGIAPPGRDTLNIGELRSALAGMEKLQTDIKIVFLHWGYEYELLPDPVIRNLARDMVLAGADLVIGHHPHMVQPIELYYLNGYQNEISSAQNCPVRLQDKTGIPRKALVAYSLGNFISRMYTQECQTGIMLPLTLYTDPDTGIKSWTVEYPVRVKNKVPLLPGRKHTVSLQDH